MRDKAETHIGLWLRFGDMELRESEDGVRMRRWRPYDFYAEGNEWEYIHWSPALWTAFIRGIRAGTVYAPNIDSPATYYEDGEFVDLYFTWAEWHGLIEFLKEHDLLRLGRDLNLVSWPQHIKLSYRSLPGASRSTGPGSNHQDDQ